MRCKCTGELVQQKHSILGKKSPFRYDIYLDTRERLKSGSTQLTHTKRSFPNLSLFHYARSYLAAYVLVIFFLILTVFD